MNHSVIIAETIAPNMGSFSLFVEHCLLCDNFERNVDRKAGLILARRIALTSSHPREVFKYLARRVFIVT